MANIFLQYDADGLERRYMPARWPNVDRGKTAAKWDGLSDPFYARTKVIEDVAYGDGNRERIDLFLPRTGASSAPILAFIHGGYWRSPRLTKRNYSFCIDPIVAAGAVVASLEYDLCPDVTMDRIVDQVRHACTWLWRNVESHGGDPSRIHVTGHSAGGHLSAMMATTDWPSFQAGLPDDMLKSIIPISGLFELEPLRLSSLNETLKLDEEAASRNSPRYLKPTRKMPISVIVGGGETDEFRRQSREFAADWYGLAESMEYIETAGHDHFEVMESMVEPRSILTTTMLRHLSL